MPAVRDTLQFVLARVVECQTRTSCDVLHRLRHEDLSGTGLRRDPCADVNGDPPELVADDLALTGVYPDAEVDPDLARGSHHRLRALDRHRGGVEGREEPITCGIDLSTTEAVQLGSHARVVHLEEIGPRPVSERDSPFGRTDDVGET